MEFQEALKILNIEDYSSAIMTSNSHGELFHLGDYVIIAMTLEDNPLGIKWFREWFEFTVQFAKENWKRPESVYQHILTTLQQQAKQINL